MSIAIAVCFMPLSALALSTTTFKIMGDVNGDGAVDVADIASVISVMAGEVGAGSVTARTDTRRTGAQGDSQSANPADTNGDGAVDVADIATIITFMASSNMSKTLQLEKNSLYACAAGDTIMTQWSLVRKLILERLKAYGVTEENFETAYKMAPGLYVPKTETDLDNTENWVLNTSGTENYGNILFSPEDNKLGVAFRASEMLNILSQRNEKGKIVDNQGNVTQSYRDRAYHPYTDYKVAVRLTATGHDDWPDMVVAFSVRIYQNVATMSRPSNVQNGGSWYSLNQDIDAINANIDAYDDGTYPQDVRRLLINLQNCLDGQQWLATTDRQGAFDFSFDSIVGSDRSICEGINRAKLNELHGELYFYTNNSEDNVEEGTPYWHDANHTPDCLDDRFYADRYLIKASYTNEPLDTVKADGSKLGKYLFAYKYIEASETYDMAGGQMIAYIDNLDTRSVDMGITASADVDADGRPNENVNVHFNWASTFMRDLLNRAGRYAESSIGPQDGYSKTTDNPFGARLCLRLYEDDGQQGVPVALTNPDFIVRPLRPLNVEFKTPWQQSSVMAADDAMAAITTCTIRYSDLFRNQTGSPYARIFPMDWRNYSLTNKKWIGFYQGLDEDANGQWDADNVVPDIAHMLINIGGSEGLYAGRASQLGMKISHTYNNNGNIVSTIFEYLNDGITRGGFDIIIPITLKYAWGDITTTGHWEQTAELPHTANQYYHNYNMNYVKLHFGPTIGN
ncbi:MAG: dockerin type I repeat-containing protein [Prevotella sp.]|nr:dockerin type I repeat-containing protein [Prevotella sp.]